MDPTEAMKFRPMPLVCECGFVPVRLKTVGFTSEYELVVHWRCIACGKLVYVVKPLADCVRDCPDEAGEPEPPMPDNSRDRRLSDDARFLSMMGIRLPSEFDD